MLSWRFGMMDMGGDWSCASLSADVLQEVRTKLLEYEKKTWDESYSKKGAGLKKVDATGICSRAFERLKTLKLDDAAALWEFHLTGKQRVWGIRIGTVCYLLWWDPDHTVWPSAKK